MHHPPIQRELSFIRFSKLVAKHGHDMVHDGCALYPFMILLGALVNSRKILQCYLNIKGTEMLLVVLQKMVKSDI